MKTILITLTLFSIIFANPLNEPTPLDEDPNDEAHMPISQIIEKHGYPCETHFVETSDGYILQMHRIPHGQNGKHADIPNKKVAFVQHGILSSSVDWIIIGDNSLGYLLADQGYDVWMGNTRGNTFSRNHSRLNPDKDTEFWVFSWHEIGIIDLPAMIDYTLQVTQQEKVFYIGHSQGTTAFYVMASSRPEYNDKIAAHFSLAPIAFMSHMTSPLFQIISFWARPLGFLLEIIGVNEFLPSNDFISLATGLFCKDNSLFQPICTNALFAICGFNPGEMNATMLPVIGGHSPAGASTRQILHYAQEIRSGRFRQYDYGVMGNLHQYGAMSPPDYNLKAITAPTYLFYSHNDWLASEIDVNKLYGKLGNCKGKFLNGENGFNHLDYMFGTRAKDLVYNRVLSLMTKY